MSNSRLFSVAVVAIFAISAQAGAMTFEEYQQRELSLMQNETAEQEEVAMSEQEQPEEESSAIDEASVARGKKIYEKKCRGCHGNDGRGNGKMAKALGNRVLDLTASTSGMSDEQLYDVITDGKSPMPSYKNTLSEQNRRDLVNYIRDLAPKND